MGACGSKSSSASSGAGARSLSQWETQAADVNSGSAADGVPVDGEAVVATESEEAKDLALNCVVLDPTDSEFCLTAWEDGSIRRLHWRSQRVVATWTPHTRAVNRLVMSGSDQQQLTTYSCSRDTTIAVLRGETSAPVSVLRGHNLSVSAIAVDTTEQKSLCSGGRDTQTIFWDLPTARIKSKSTTSQNVITCCKWIPRERSLVAQGSEDLSIKIWDERSALRAPVQRLDGYVYFPLSIDVSNDGLHLLTSSKGFNGVGGEVRVWDRRLGRQLVALDGHQQDATSCCFLRAQDDGQSMMGDLVPVSASKDGTVKVWDIANARLHAEARESSDALFTSLCALPDQPIVLASTFRGQVLTYHVDVNNQSVAPVQAHSSMQE